MNASEFDLQLQDLYERSVGRLACADVFDRAAFDAFIAYLTEKAEQIADEHVVSKQVLNYLFSAHSAIDNCSAHNAEVDRNLADEMLRLLEMIASGSKPSERIPGVPRII
jgi:hypothetical protein